MTRESDAAGRVVAWAATVFVVVVIAAVAVRLVAWIWP